MKLSVVIPVKNQSQKLLGHLKESILPYFDGTKLTYDVIIVADGGSQEEYDLLVEGLKDLPAQVRLLPLENIKGKGHAVKKGIMASSSEYVLFMDADLATDLKVFDLIQPELGKKDCFIASRDLPESEYGRPQPFMRRITHNGCRMVTHMLLHMNDIQDTQCGYKCIRTKLAKKACKLSIIDGFAFDAELLYILHLHECSIVELPCLWTDDPDSTVGSPFKTAKKFYADLIMIMKNRDNYIKGVRPDAH